MIDFTGKGKAQQWNKNGTIICDINPFMLSELFYLNSLDQSISSLRGVWSVLIITMFHWNGCS